MNISKLLLSTTLIIMSCSNIYATDQYEALGLNDFNYQYLSSKYIVNDDGALCGKSNSNLYPTYDGQKLYDMKTYLEKNGNITVTIILDIIRYSQLQVPMDVNPFNLVVFTFNPDESNTYNYDKDTTYTVTRTESMPTYNTNDGPHLRINITKNTNLIVPHGTTLDCKDVELLFNNEFINSNILILGNITNTNQSYISTFLDTCYGNINVILGPNAVFDYNKIDKYSLIRYGRDTTKCILYPGCEIKTNNIAENLSKVNIDNDYPTIFQSAGNLYLNRYIEEGDETNRNKLVGTIRANSHIIYPTTMDDINGETYYYLKQEYKLYKAGNEAPYDLFERSSYFPSLYWDDTGHSYNPNLGSKEQYHFEEPVPIVFDDATKVLQLNLDNELAKYDVAFWNQCSVESGLYSFKEFVNKSGNKDKYINVDTLETLFIDGKTYNNTGLLQNMPNEIFVSIIGNKDIKIKQTNTKQVILFGDNSGYNGIMIIPDNITDVCLNKKQSIVKIMYKYKLYNITIDADDKISYKVNGTETEPKDLGLNFHFIDVDFENIINYCKFENISNYVGLINYLDYYKKQNAKLTDTIDSAKTDVTNAIDSLKIGEVKTGIGEVKAEVGNVKDQVETKFKAIQKELSKINNTLNKPHKDMSTQTESSNKFKYNFDLKYSNEIEVDLNDEMSTTKAIVLEDNGFIKNTILWLKGDNRNFEGIVITPKHIEKVIFYPNSFCKVINPSGKKLKYKFVDENGNYIHH